MNDPKFIFEFSGTLHQFRFPDYSDSDYDQATKTRTYKQLIELPGKIQEEYTWTRRHSSVSSQKRSIYSLRSKGLFMEINATTMQDDYPIDEVLFEVSTTFTEKWIQQIGRQQMKGIIEELRFCDADSIKFSLPTTTGFSFTVFQNRTDRFPFETSPNFIPWKLEFGDQRKITVVAIEGSNNGNPYHSRETYIKFKITWDNAKEAIVDVTFKRSNSLFIIETYGFYLEITYPRHSGNLGVFTKLGDKWMDQELYKLMKEVLAASGLYLCD